MNFPADQARKSDLRPDSPAMLNDALIDSGRSAFIL